MRPKSKLSYPLYGAGGGGGVEEPWNSNYETKMAVA